MAKATLYSAFAWQCEDCSEWQFERAEIGEVDEDVAKQVIEQLETVEAYETQDGMETHELVYRVCVAPSFVTCRHCGTTHAAFFREEWE